MLISSLFSTPLVDAFWTAQPGCARNSTGFFWGLGGFARRIHLRVSSPKLASFEASVRAIPTAWDLAGCFCLAALTQGRDQGQATKAHSPAEPCGSLGVGRVPLLFVCLWPLPQIAETFPARLDLKPAGQTGAGKSYSMVGYGANKVGTCWDWDQSPQCTATEDRTCSTEFCDRGLPGCALLTCRHTVWLHHAGHRAHLVRRDFQKDRRLPPRIQQLLEPSLLKNLGTSSRFCSCYFKPNNISAAAGYALCKLPIVHAGWGSRGFQTAWQNLMNMRGSQF